MTFFHTLCHSHTAIFFIYFLRKFGPDCFLFSVYFPIFSVPHSHTTFSATHELSYFQFNSIYFIDQLFHTFNSLYLFLTDYAPVYVFTAVSSSLFFSFVSVLLSFHFISPFLLYFLSFNFSSFFLFLFPSFFLFFNLFLLHSSCS